MKSHSPFGPFATLLESDPGYLELLNLPNGERIQPVIDQIQYALEDGDSKRWVAALLHETDWRPHLVASIAHILDGGSMLDSGPLWSAIDRGSWSTWSRSCSTPPAAPGSIRPALALRPLFLVRLLLLFRPTLPAHAIGAFS